MQGRWKERGGGDRQADRQAARQTGRQTVRREGAVAGEDKARKTQADKDRGGRRLVRSGDAEEEQKPEIPEDACVRSYVCEADK